MWKLVPTFCKRLLYKHGSSLSPQTRFFLSESFKLESVWNERLQSPILNKINTNDMYYELDHQFQHFAFASALDIDLFVNSVNDDSSFDEVEDVVHKLRLSPEAINILPSTQHALIRLYLKCNRIDDLIRVLDDRLNYGIFPDDYCSMLMMDTFIKAGNFRDAAKISTMSMLQEDVSNPLIKYMSLYCCHKYLEKPVLWNNENNEQVEEDDDEEVKVRVKYIRNPYFDDHFDLVNSNHLIGKTFTFIGSEIDDHVGRTYKLLGLLLHEKLSQAKEYIKYLLTLKDNSIVLQGGLVLANEILDENSKTECKDDSFKTLANELKELLSKSFTVSQLADEDNLSTLVEIQLKDLVSKNETSEINKQLQVYKEWEKNRETLLMKQIETIKRENLLAEVQRQKQFLKEKEEELTFFDNEEKLDLIIEAKEKRKEEQRERERKILESKKIPPALSRKVIQKTEEPQLESFFDENIPMKLIKTKL